MIKNSIGRGSGRNKYSRQTTDGFDTRDLNTDSFDHNKKSNYTNGYRGGGSGTNKFGKYKDESTDDDEDDLENGGNSIDYGDEDWGANY